MIANIKQTRTEYARVGKSWVVVGTNVSVVDSNYITSMLNAQPYLTNMGGQATNKFRTNRRFGKVVSSIDVIAANQQTRCSYHFSYTEAIDYDKQNVKAERGYPVLSRNNREIRAYI